LERVWALFLETEVVVSNIDNALTLHISKF
jgi:hypothetical protein